MFLEIKQIKKSFGQGDSRVEVLKGIDLSLNKGEVCVLLGPSGSGKSTLLNIIGGIDSADAGEIVIDGEPMSNMGERRLTMYRRRHLGYIFQMYNLIPNLTVRENIEVGAYLSDKPLDVDELLKLLGLWEHRGKVPSQLSGGCCACGPVWRKKMRRILRKGKRVISAVLCAVLCAALMLSAAGCAGKEKSSGIR